MFAAHVRRSAGPDSGSGAVAQAEALYRQYRAKKEVLQGKTKEQVMERYGNAAERAGEEVLALAQSENYVEYNAQVLHRWLCLPLCARGHMSVLNAHILPASSWSRATCMKT